MHPVILLLAKAAIAAKPHDELEQLCDEVAAKNPGFDVTFALQELGAPSLRSRLNELTDQGVEEIIIVSLLIPMEPAFPNWIKRSVHRWKATRQGEHFPVIRLAQPPMIEKEGLADLVGALSLQADESDIVKEDFKMPSGSVVPNQEFNFLICNGGHCNDSGSITLYNHIRNRQTELKAAGIDSIRSCKTSCLGPCSLAPVVRVWPSGTIYGGVTEEILDEIIESEVLKGEPLEKYAYRPNGKKQALRKPDKKE